MKKLGKWVAVASLTLAVSTTAMAGPRDKVQLEQGTLTGVAGSVSSVRVFKGIPYAKPPLGSLRWRAPEPAPGWTGVRTANKYGPSCMQPATVIPPQPGTTERSDLFLVSAQDGMSEDCLYLNVWTPASSASAKLPVMVYIHGGAFVSGSGNTVITEPSRLAKRGVVIVSINYRLGAFGFFDHAELVKESGSTGNYGILDQIEALKWVQKNIAAFGGDPSRVTIFGGSAGSMSVSLLTASPLAKGLFRGAIAESGTAFSSAVAGSSSNQAQLAGAKFLSVLGVGNIAEARALTAETILKAQATAGFAGRPTMGGSVLPQSPPAIYAAGQQNDVAVIVGWNADEYTILARSLLGGGTASGFKEAVEKRFGANASTILKDYPAADDAEARLSAGHLFSDEAFGVGAALWAEAQAQTGKQPIFIYHFTHPAPIPQGTTLFGKTGVQLGATHGGEMYYVFGKLADLKWPWTKTDQKLERVMQGYWVNFAAKGDPNGAGLPRWTQVAPGHTPQILKIGDTTEMEPLPRAASFAILRTPPANP